MGVSSTLEKLSFLVDNTHCTGVEQMLNIYKKSNNFDKRPNRLEEILRRRQDSGKVIDKWFARSL